MWVIFALQDPLTVLNPDPIRIRNPAPRKRFCVLPDVYLVQERKLYAEASGEELARDPAQLEEDLCDDTHRILQCKLRLGHNLF